MIGWTTANAFLSKDQQHRRDQLKLDAWKTGKLHSDRLPVNTGYCCQKAKEETTDDRSCRVAVTWSGKLENFPNNSTAEQVMGDGHPI